MRKLIFVCAVLLTGAVSCTKSFDKLNTSPSRLTSPDLEPVMTQVFKMTADRSEIENYNFFWEYSHIIEPTGQRYNAADDGVWKDFYLTGFGNTLQLKKVYGNNPQYTNRIAIVNIWECYMYAYLVGTYGAIPYSKTGSTDNYIPYDDENSIYTDLLARLKQASDAINLSGDKLTTDVIYAGDLLKWKKFANSLRLRLALRCQRSIPEPAVAAIRDIMANESMLLSSDADNPKLTYGTADGSQSQYWNKYVKSVVQVSSYPVMNDYAFTYFRSYNDPRMRAYFNQSVSGFSITDTLTSTADNLHHIVTYKIPYLGAPNSPGILSTWNLPTTFYNGSNYTDSYSTLPGVNQKAITATAGINMVAADRPFYFMTYAEVCFLQAEAAELGFGGAKSADTYYYNGINANFAFWGLTPAQANAYEGQPGIQWNTTGHGFNYPLGFINTSIPADNLTKIWIQEWLNSYGDGGFDAWCLFRRTRVVTLPPLIGGSMVNISSLYADLPDRFSYPTTELTTNPRGVADGVKLMGSDYPTTQLKFAKPYTHFDWTTVRTFYDYSLMRKWYGTTIQSLTLAGVPFTETGKY